MGEGGMRLAPKRVLAIFSGRHLGRHPLPDRAMFADVAGFLRALVRERASSIIEHVRAQRRGPR